MSVGGPWFEVGAAAVCTRMQKRVHLCTIVHDSAQLYHAQALNRALFCRSVHDCAPATAPSCTILQNCARLRAHHMSDKCVLLDRFQNQCFPYIQPFRDWKEPQLIKSVSISLSGFFLVVHTYFDCLLHLPWRYLARMLAPARRHPHQRSRRHIWEKPTGHRNIY